jgi:hypothetical protein
MQAGDGVFLSVYATLRRRIKKPPSPDLTNATGCKHPRLNMQAVVAYLKFISQVSLGDFLAKIWKQDFKIMKSANHCRLKSYSYLKPFLLNDVGSIFQMVWQTCGRTFS